MLTMFKVNGYIQYNYKHIFVLDQEYVNDMMVASDKKNVWFEMMQMSRSSLVYLFTTWLDSNYYDYIQNIINKMFDLTLTNHICIPNKP